MPSHHRVGKLPTLADVAASAGVSVPTASRILNGGVRGDRVGTTEVRTRVRKAAEELGYSASRAAQAIKGGRSNSAAVIVSDIADVGAAAMLSGVMEAAEEHAISVTVLASHDDEQTETTLLSRLRGERHRAVIVATSRTTDPARESALDLQLRVLRNQGVGVVVIGENDLDFPAVTFDNRRATRRLAIELAGLGHRRFAICSGPADQITPRNRAEGFVAGLRSAEIDPAAVLHVAFSRDGGYQAVHALREHISSLDVIATMSDAMAVGAITALRELGLEAPRDVEVTGFDHVPLLSDLLSNFTTVHVPLKELGTTALEMALQTAPGTAAYRRVELQGKTFVRGTAVD